MNPVPQEVFEAAHTILIIDECNEIIRSVEGALHMVDADNYLELLRHAETVARWVKTYALASHEAAK